MLRRIPQFLRFIPGTAQDVRAYFLTLQYWLAGSEENIANMVRFLVGRYAAGPRSRLLGAAKEAAPIEYPQVGVYHPRMATPLQRAAHGSSAGGARVRDGAGHGGGPGAALLSAGRQLPHTTTG